MRNYVDIMRKEFRDDIVVEDSPESGIPAGRVFRVRVPCNLAHPGLCPHKNAAIFAQGIHIMHNLETFCLQRCVTGSILLLSSQPETKDMYLAVGYIRKVSPFVVVVARLHLEGEDRLLLSESEDGDLVPMLFSEVAAEFLRDGATSLRAQIVNVASLPHTAREVIKGQLDEQHEVMLEHVKLSKIKADKVKQADDDEAFGRIAAGFRNLQVGRRKPVRGRQGQRGFESRGSSVVDQRRW